MLLVCICRKEEGISGLPRESVVVFTQLRLCFSQKRSLLDICGQQHSLLATFRCFWPTNAVEGHEWPSKHLSAFYDVYEFGKRKNSRLVAPAMMKHLQDIPFTQNFQNPPCSPASKPRGSRKIRTAENRTFKDHGKCVERVAPDQSRGAIFPGDSRRFARIQACRSSS